MSIGCSYENVLQQDVFKILKEDTPDINLISTMVYRPKILDYKILSEPYTEEIEIDDPCGTGQKIKVQAELKKIIVVASVSYDILLLSNDDQPDLYDGGINFITAYDIYKTVPLEEDVPEDLNIVPEFTLEVTRIIPENDDDVDYYLFAVDGKVDLTYK